MSYGALARLAGVALLASGVLATVGFSIHPHEPGANLALWVGAHVAILSGGFLNLLGLAGLYLLSAPRLGGAGLAGFVLAAVSLVLYLGKLYWSGFIYPLVTAQHPEFIRAYGFIPGTDPVDPVVKAVFYLGPILFAAGYTLLGISLLKLKAYPAAALWAMIVGALLVGLWPLLPDVVQHLSVVVSLVYTVGVGWIGYLMARASSSP
jgi:hypothetical protein